MKKSGGIIAIVAGAFGVIAAVITLFVGGISGALEVEDASTVVGLGWAGLFLSFVTIILGAAVISAKKRSAAILLIICSVVTAIAGGTLVAIIMVLAFLGGLLALFDPSYKATPATKAPTQA